MDTKEKHIKENESEARREQDAEELLAQGKNRHNNHSAKSNRLWIWLGVIVLIFILFYWLFSIGIFEDLLGYFNG